MSKKIAICIHAYNEELFISETIESILSQTFSDFDLIISDNHSTDNTAKIIRHYQSKDSRVILWMPDAFCQGMVHGRIITDRLNSMDYDATIIIGAHDVILPNYVELLHTAYLENPSAAIVVGRGFEIDTSGNPLRQWPDVIQLKGGHVSSRPLAILSTLFYNLPAFGLWPKKTRTNVNFRHNCVCGDHLYIAEASLHGDIIVEKNAIIKTRRTFGVGDHSTFFKKHISDDVQIDTVVADFEKQMEWICHINGLAYAGFPEVTKDIILAGTLGIWFSLYGITGLKGVDGALEKWLASSSGLTVASQMSSIGSAARLNSLLARP